MRTGRQYSDYTTGFAISITWKATLVQGSLVPSELIRRGLIQPAIHKASVRIMLIKHFERTGDEEDATQNTDNIWYFPDRPENFRKSDFTTFCRVALDVTKTQLRGCSGI